MTCFLSDNINICVEYRCVTVGSTWNQKEGREDKKSIGGERVNMRVILCQEVEDTAICGEDENQQEVGGRGELEVSKKKQRIILYNAWKYYGETHSFYANQKLNKSCIYFILVAKKVSHPFQQSWLSNHNIPFFIKQGTDIPWVRTFLLTVTKDYELTHF